MPNIPFATGRARTNSFHFSTQMRKNDGGSAYLARFAFDDDVATLTDGTGLHRYRFGGTGIGGFKSFDFVVAHCSQVCVVF
jgi:hypothetical protein